MLVSVIRLIFLVHCLCSSASSLEIVDKLNFKDEVPQSVSKQNKLIASKNLKRESTFENANTKDNFSNIGIVCTTGGCNTTSKSEDSSVIQTDVLVSVKTKVDTSKNTSTAERKQILEETPDIPIVVGYKGVSGTTIDRGYNDNTFTNNPDYDTRYNIQIPHSYQNQFHPISTPSFVNSYENRYSQISHNNERNENTYYPPVRVPNNFYPTTYENNNPESNIRHTLQSEDRQINNHNQDDYQIKVPYFEPSYSNHYHGENPPPQIVTIPRRFLKDFVNTRERSNFNPNSFVSDNGYGRKYNSNWRPSVYNIKDLLEPRRRIDIGNSDCVCQGKSLNGHGVVLVGDASNANTRVLSADPGSQINDKLAPLN